MIKICLDAGHGGSDPGADGPTGLSEAPVVLEIATMVANDLVGSSFSVMLTRITDEYVSLQHRCDIANEWAANYFVSIHLNSNGPSAVGVETLYKTETGKKLAAKIQEQMLAATKDVDRGLKQRSDLYVLNGTFMPACLAEAGFISHPETEAKFKMLEYKQLVALAIAEGIRKFCNVTKT